MTKMMQLVVRKVIWMRTDAVQCKKSNFNYQQKSEVYIEGEYLSKATGTYI